MLTVARLNCLSRPNVINCRHLSHLQSHNNGLLEPQRRHFEVQRRNLSYFDQYLQFIRETVQSLGDSKLTTYLVDKLCLCHDLSGLPWWSVIVLTGLGMRLCLTFPTQIFSQRVVGRRRLAYIEMQQESIPALKRSLNALGRKNNWTFEHSKKQFLYLSHQLKAETIVKYNCGLAKIYLPSYFQIPVWLSTTLAFRKLIYSEGRTIQMMTEGPFLMRDLSLPVETMGLPIFIGLAYWLSMEVVLNSREKTGVISNAKAHTFVTYFLRSTVLLMVFLSTKVESGLCLYWASSAAMALSTNLILLSPKVRSICGIAKFPDDPKNPYKILYQNMAEKSRKAINLFKPK